MICLAYLSTATSQMQPAEIEGILEKSRPLLRVRWAVEKANTPEPQRLEQSGPSGLCPLQLA